MSLAGGATSFIVFENSSGVVVKNGGSMKQNFEIRGQGVEKKFMMDVAPNDSKTLHVDLKPGTYKVHIPETNGPETTLLVK